MHVSYGGMQRELNDRYEPLPGLLQLPGFVWRRLPLAARIAVAVAALAAVVLAIVLRPVIQQSRKEHARAEAAELARIRQAELERTRREQRPRFARGTAAGADLEARRQLLASAEASIRTDANTRAAAGEFNGPILRVQCEGYPPAAGRLPADAVPSKRTGRYGCLAVTSDIPATSGNRSGVVGHPYRVLINFQNGRYAFCKIRGRPGELAVRAGPSVPVPRVCGG
jgi:type II secretory pathway pseudopilin PulG